MSRPQYVEVTLGDHLGCLGAFIGIMVGFGCLLAAGFWVFGLIVKGFVTIAT